MGKCDQLIRQALDEAGYQSPAEAIMQIPLRYERPDQATIGRLPDIDKCVEIVLLARVRSVVQESIHPPRFSASLSRLNESGDGFELSELDLNHRGFGDVSDDSEQQAGEVVTLFSNVKFYPPAVDAVGKAISAVRGEEAGW